MFHFHDLQALLEKTNALSSLLVEQDFGVLRQTSDKHQDVWSSTVRRVVELLPDGTERFEGDILNLDSHERRDVVLLIDLLMVLELANVNAIETCSTFTKAICVLSWETNLTWSSP